MNSFTSASGQIKILCFCNLNVKYFLKDHSQKCRNKTEYIKRWKRINKNVNMLEEEMWEKESRGKTTDEVI